MLTEIKFNDELSIYTCLLNNIDINTLSKDLELNIDVIDNKVTSGETRAGVQAEIKIVSKNITNLRNEITKKIIEFIGLTDDYVYFNYDWVYISDNRNKTTFYHDHISGYNSALCKESPQWTLVYYAQMPNNLKENDGLLFFKTKDNKEFSILPKEGQLILFKSDVLHKPGLNEQSTTKRIVYGSNVAILDRNKKYIKKDKTLF